MTPDDFTILLEERLRLMGTRFSRADLKEFVAGCWPRIQDDPNVAYWADQFIDSGKADLTA